MPEKTKWNASAVKAQVGEGPSFRNERDGQPLRARARSAGKKRLARPFSVHLKLVQKCHFTTPSLSISGS